MAIITTWFNARKSRKAQLYDVRCRIYPQFLGSCYRLRDLFGARALLGKENSSTAHKIFGLHNEIRDHLVEFRLSHLPALELVASDNVREKGRVLADAIREYGNELVQAAGDGIRTSDKWTSFERATAEAQDAFIEKARVDLA